MDQQQYDRVREIFLEVADLEGEAQKSRVRELAAGSAEVEAEVLSLLGHHDPDDDLIRPGSQAGAPPSPLTGQVSRVVKKKETIHTGAVINSLVSTPARRIGLVAAMAAVVLALGIWTYLEVKSSLIELKRDELQTVLNADVLALELWIKERKADVEMMARDREVIRLTSELVRRAGHRSEGARALTETTAWEELLEKFDEMQSAEGYLGFKVVDTTYMVVASNNESQAGAKLTPLGIQHYSVVMEGGTRFNPPAWEAEFIRAGSAIKSEKPFISVDTSLRDENGIIYGVLSIELLAGDDFDEILSVAESGETGDTYAFDKDGRLLSYSRTLHDLTDGQINYIRIDGRERFSIYLRDPGGNLEEGFEPESLPEEWPLTHAVATAIHSARYAGTRDTEGTIMEPHRDYRGVDVVVAWDWLEHYDFGVLTKVDTAEAFRPLFYLVITFAILLGIISLCMFLILLSYFSMARLRGRLDAGTSLGPYTTILPIGEGGMGSVFLSRHQLLKRPTAVKVLKAGMGSADDTRRFEQEVLLASQLSHPNTIQIYDFGVSEDGRFYYAMEFLEGFTLADFVTAGGAVPVSRVLHILEQITLSLREAHARGMIHRDIKPQNVMLCCVGGCPDVVKVLDFGLVKDITDNSESMQTKTRLIAGTPVYMAPERFNDPRHLTPTVDVYAIGAVAYYLLTGREVFTGYSNEAVILSIYESMPVPPREVRDEVPGPVSDLVMACLAKDPAGRPPSADDLLSRLRELQKAVGPWTEDEATVWWQESPLAREKQHNVRFLLEQFFDT